jgi:hypothetical protein
MTSPSLRHFPVLSEVRDTGVLFSQDPYQNGSLAGAVVEIDEHDLLPCPEKEISIAEGNAQRRAEERRADMGESIAVPPPGVVVIMDGLGGHAFDRLGKVLQYSRFILDGGDPGG